MTTRTSATEASEVRSHAGRKRNDFTVSPYSPSGIFGSETGRWRVEPTSRRLLNVPTRVRSPDLDNKQTVHGSITKKQYLKSKPRVQCYVKSTKVNAAFPFIDPFFNVCLDRPNRGMNSDLSPVSTLHRSLVILST